MNVEFRKSFEKDLSKIKDAEILQRIQAVIEEIELIAHRKILCNLQIWMLYRRFPFIMPKND